MMLAHASSRTINDSGTFATWKVASIQERLEHGADEPGLRVLADFAARLGTIEPEAIEPTLVECLRQVADALHFDRAILWRKASDPFIGSKLETGEVAWFARIEDVPDAVDREALEQCGFQSAAVVPVLLSGGVPDVRGAMVFGSMRSRHCTPSLVAQLRLASGVFGQALARQASQETLTHANEELQRLRAQLAEHTHTNVGPFRHSRDCDQWRAENQYLRHEGHRRLGTSDIVGQSLAIRRVLEQAEQVAATQSTVLLLGETGTGKELIATRIHELSARRGRVMVRVNCSAIPATLIESELFGREKGAFTGALARQIGRFEAADQATIFLDEIGDLSPDIQVKLLRVLEERVIERLGSPQAIGVDVRIIAATHRNLEARLHDGTFREDLFYRLNVFPIQVPPLRDRPEDIPLLVWRFVDDFSKSFGKRIDAITRENMAALQQYSWPGNIRELRNVVERAMIVTSGPLLTIALPRAAGLTGRGSVKMADIEKEHVRSVLESSGWRVRGQGGAAERLGLRPTTLETRMAKLGLSRPKHLASAFTAISR